MFPNGVQDMWPCVLGAVYLACELQVLPWDARSATWSRPAQVSETGINPFPIPHPSNKALS